MAIVFCTVKLAKLTGAKTRLPSLSMNNWNGHLFALEGRKCIVFVHKATYYSFVLFNVLKKDLTNFKKLFIEQYLQQLDNDGLLTDALKENIINDYSEIELSTTDGDKNTIGFINDCISRITWETNGKAPTIAEAKVYVYHHCNDNFLLNKIHYKTTPKNTMAEYLENTYNTK